MAERQIKPAVDCISSLPDEILHHIFSYVPTKLAIRTSALSTRWKHVWYETPSLSIDFRRKHPSSVNKTLCSYSAPKITSFHLDDGCNSDVTASHIDRWIELAMSRNAENLSLIIRKSDYSFPDFFYVNSSVKQLSLTLGLFPDMIPDFNVSWTSLRNLSLNRCNLDDESFPYILSGCPMLESLKLDLCRKLDHLDLSNSPNLTRLEIIANHYKCGPEEIVAPHIHCLRLTKCNRPCTLVDVSSLREASFNFSYFTCRREELVLKMLAKLQNVEKLTIGAVLLQILSLAELHGAPFPQLKIKALTLETVIVPSVIPGVVRLLKSLPGLKKITVYTAVGKVGILDGEKLNIYLKSQGLSYFDRRRSWSFPEVEQTCSLINGIATDAKSADVAFFLRLVLRNAEALETMVVRLGGYLNATEYQKLLPMVPAVSGNKNGRNYSFKIFP